MIADIVALTSCDSIEKLDHILFQIFTTHFGEANFMFYKNIGDGSSLFTRVESSGFGHIVHPLSMDEINSLIEIYDDEPHKISMPSAQDATQINSILVIFKPIDEAAHTALMLLVQAYGNLQLTLNRAQLDGLTQLNNRRMFDTLMPRMLSQLQVSDERRQMRLHEQSHCLMMFDIDHFKKVNDTFGHLYGDEVLLFVSQIMRACFRGDDLLFRYGGEEFIVFLKEIPIDAAYASAERFLQKVSNFVFPQVGHISVTIGMTFVDGNCSLHALTEQADKALYYGKQNGRNQFNSYQQLIDDGLIQASEQGDDIELF